MAVDEGTKIRDRARYTGPQSTDLLVIEKVSNSSVSNTLVVTVQDLLGNSAANVVVGNSYWISAKNVKINNANTPANSSAAGYSIGQIWTDGGYLYWVAANGSILRAAGSTF